jgi:16S rRNA (guanine527-N7)-methyltransferase
LSSTQKSGANRAHPDPDELLATGAERLGVKLRTDQVLAFRTYREEILRWAGRMSLTALTRPDEIVRHGFLDALACAPLIPLGARRALDVGSGAGFPAIPIAILRSNLDFTLIEVSRKKISFLRHVVRLLALSRVHSVLGRAEEIVERETDMAATFDLASARAVAPLAKIGALIFPFLRPGGVFLAQVGSGRETDAALGRLIDMGFERAGEISVPAWIGAPSHEILALRKSVGK